MPRSWIYPDYLPVSGIDPNAQEYRRCFDPDGAPHPYDFMDPDEIAEAQWFQHYAAWHAEDGTETSLFDEPPHPEETAYDCLLLSGDEVPVTDAAAVFNAMLAAIEGAKTDDQPY